MVSPARYNAATAAQLDRHAELATGLDPQFGGALAAVIDVAATG